MNILFIGDIVARPGRDLVRRLVAPLVDKYAADVVIANGENAAGGSGITREITTELLKAGVHALTSGNHIWAKREVFEFIDGEPRLLRPANFPPGTPGRGATMVETRKGARVLVVNLMGRLYMDPLDDPFAVADRALEAAPLREIADAILVDIHAEATSEKQALAYHLDGRVSAVVGTHTHVPTADHRILPGGTAYMSDAGMCGDYESVLGMARDEPIRRFLHKTPGARLEAASGEGALSGLAIEIDDRTGLAVRVAALRLGPKLEESWPGFWD